MKAGWKRKKQKYENTAFGDVIPVVVSPNFEMSRKGPIGV